MSHPKGMRAWTRPLASGGQIHVYSDDVRIIFQLRRDVPTAEEVLAPSFKVALALNPDEALAVAGELLTVCSKLLSTTTKSGCQGDHTAQHSCERESTT